MTARRINVRGIIFKDGQVLAQQLTPGSDGKIRDYWCTPGGGLEAGESLHTGLTREMIEETGIAPVIGRLLFVQQFSSPSKGGEQIEFFFHIENTDDYNDIDLAKTTHGAIETTNIEFVDPTQHNILPSFLQSTDIAAYVNGALPPLIDSEL